MKLHNFMILSEYALIFNNSLIQRAISRRISSLGLSDITKVFEKWYFSTKKLFFTKNHIKVEETLPTT